MKRACAAIGWPPIPLAARACSTLRIRAQLRRLDRVNKQSEQRWLELCRTEGIDPDEVRLVFSRYEAYRQYTEKLSQPIPLERWFRFYRIEKSSEGDEAQPAPSGCSIDSDAVNNACISRPTEFLAVLEAYAVARRPA
jgi:hypothetical protein